MTAIEKVQSLLDSLPESRIDFQKDVQFIVPVTVLTNTLEQQEFEIKYMIQKIKKKYC